jgi:hypothetical protein
MAGLRGKGDERFTLEISPPPKELAEDFDRLGKRFDDWRPAWRDMLYPVFVEGIQRNLATQGQALGERWPGLEREYARRKARLGSRMLLKLTGRLRGSFKALKVTKRLISFGTEVPHARAVQYGKGRLAKRRFVGWSPAMRAKATEIMTAHAKRLTDEAFRVRAGGA